MDDLIQWPEATYWNKPWNAWLGCRPISPACDNCYARCATIDRFGQSFEPHRTNKKSPPQSGVVFCGNMTDLWGDWISKEESMSILDKLFYFDPHGGGKRPFDATYLFCTKRVGNMLITLRDYPEVPNAYFGFTAENQEWFNRRVDHAAAIPFRHKLWLSAEPLLGPIDMGDMVEMFKWVAVGCESGANRRPCKLEWIESIVEQCRAANVPVFVKQIDLNGKCERDITKFPKHLQIRQVPWFRQVLQGRAEEGNMADGREV